MLEKCPRAGSRSADSIPHALPSPLTRALSEPFAPRSASSTLYYKILLQLSVQSHHNYNHCCNHIQLLSPLPRCESIVTGLRGPSVPPRHPGNSMAVPCPLSFLLWSCLWGLALTLRDASFLHILCPQPRPPGTAVPVGPGAALSNPLPSGWACAEECGRVSHQVGDDRFSHPSVTILGRFSCCS